MRVHDIFTVLYIMCNALFVRVLYVNVYVYMCVFGHVCNVRLYGEYCTEITHGTCMYGSYGTCDVWCVRRII